jgi:Ala-tRNA(Pro) deacylase
MIRKDETSNMDQVLQKIKALLTERNVPCKEVHHEPTYTSIESARARGEDLRTGAKAILAKGDNAFALFVLPADCKLDSAAIKRHLGWKKIRFASREELEQMTGLVPGCVPPFGEPILPFPLFADTAVGQHNGRVAFNAGSLTDSIVMSADDWFAVANPVSFEFGVKEAKE